MHETLPIGEQRRRLDALRRALAEAGLDALLIPSTPARPGDGAYVTGHFPWARLAYVVVRLDDDEPHLFTSMASEAYWAREQPWRVNVHFVAGDDLVSSAFRELGGASAHVGISQLSSLMPAEDLRKLAALIKDPPVDATGILGDLRCVKSAGELAEMEGASQLGRSILEDMTDATNLIALPRHEASLFADAERAAKSSGARQTHFLTSNRAFLRPPRQSAAFDQGFQLVSLEFSNASGYWIEIGGTFVSDDSSAAMDAMAVCDEALRAVQATLKPGRECQEAVAAFLATIQQSAWKPGIWLGHGIGLDTTEQPSLIAGSHQIIRPGMAFAVHPHVVDDAGEVGAYVARTMVVEEARTRILAYEE